MTAKKRGKRKKKGRRKFLLFLFFSGIIIAGGLFFHREIFDLVKPIQKKHSVPSDVPEGKRPEEKKRPEARRQVKLYFADNEEEYLVGEKRVIAGKGVQEEAKETIRELIKGPKGKLLPTLPARTHLLGLELTEGGVAKVNFDEHLSKEHPGGSSAEMMTLYSIVNSLTLNFPEIKKVQIFIGGKPAETISGHISLREAVAPKRDLVKE